MQTFTTSMIRSYKSCKRLYELQYIEQLKPVIEAEPLVTGKAYHKLVEDILKDQYVPENTVVGVMAEKFKEKIHPLLPYINHIEREFKVQIDDDKFLIGKIDAESEAGVPIEHKTTADNIDEKFIHRLNWDDQVTNYLLALSLERNEIINKVIYTVIKKPSIRLKQSETEEEYIARCSEWYEDKTETKIATFPVIRSKDELAEKQKELIYIADEMKNCKCFYRNPSHCSILGCRFSSICLSYTPETGSVDFIKKERRNEELNNENN